MTFKEITDQLETALQALGTQRKLQADAQAAVNAARNEVGTLQADVEKLHEQLKAHIDGVSAGQ
jgi:hypothetical protein